MTKNDNIFGIVFESVNSILILMFLRKVHPIFKEPLVWVLKFSKE